LQKVITIVKGKIASPKPRTTFPSLLSRGVRGARPNSLLKQKSLSPSEKRTRYTTAHRETISQLQLQQTLFLFCQAVRNGG
jgi:hypothetical protein